MRPGIERRIRQHAHQPPGGIEDAERRVRALS
jgi:hypothetical protein